MSELRQNSNGPNRSVNSMFHFTRWNPSPFGRTALAESGSRDLAFQRLAFDKIDYTTKSAAGKLIKVIIDGMTFSDATRKTLKEMSINRVGVADADPGKLLKITHVDRALADDLLTPVCHKPVFRLDGENRPECDRPACHLANDSSLLHQATIPPILAGRTRKGT